jgi:hypothetical protein
MSICPVHHVQLRWGACAECGPDGGEVCATCNGEGYVVDLTGETETANCPECNPPVEHTDPSKPLYRVGRHQPQNLYRDDQHIGVMFTVEDAARVAEALNATAELGVIRAALAQQRLAANQGKEAPRNAHQ